MAATPETVSAFNAPGLVISAQYIKDFSFENPNAPQIFSPSSATPDMQMGVNILTRTLAENTYEVILANKMETRLEDKMAFIIELAYAGIFSLPPMPEAQIKMALLIDCPRLLFPFARSIMMGVLRDSGFPQVMINPIDFAALYASNQDSGTVKAGAA